MTAIADRVEYATSPSAVGEVGRYPGSPPFADTDIDRMLFRGRAVETDEVLHSILSYDLFLVYAVSGMGKTSLLTAGVLEPLRQRGYFPVIVRLNTPDTGMLGLIEQQIRQAADATPGLEIVHTPSRGAEATAPTTLWDLFAELELWRGNTLQQLVLIFDQFEELFTLTWDADERARFIEQFGEVVRRHRVPGREIDPTRQVLPPPNVKVVLCMREDFIGQLEDLAVSVPQIMQRRFRLGALTPEQAHAAICEPAALDDPRLRTQRFSYTDGAASTILTFLRTKDERGKPVLTAAIDPSQLQIICQHVERSILPGKSAGPDGVVEITEGDLGGQEGLRRIVGDFYRRVLDEFPPNERKSIRHLCETGLISQTGRRLSQEEGEIHAHFDVTRDILRRLVDLRLLRSEPRVGSVYYELAHDTLTGPILAYRVAQRRARRRRIGVAALIVAGVAAAIGAALLVSRGGGSEVVGEAPVTPIEIGEDVSGEIRAPDYTALYEVAAADQPLIVELRPSGFNGVLEVSRLDETAAHQTQDVGLAGAPEFAVISAGTGRYRIAVSGPDSGEFQLSVRPARSSEVAVPGKIPASRLPTTGEPLVFQVEGSADRAFVVSVAAVTFPGHEPGAFPPGAFVQVIGPDGAATSARPDDLGPVTESGEPTTMSVVAGGTAGTYIVAIGDPSGSTKLTYDVTVDPIDITPVAVGESATVSIQYWQPRAAFEVDSLDDRALYFDLRDEQVGAQGEIRTPDGGVQSVAPGALALVSGGIGRYLVFVTSYSSGQVTLTVDVADGVDIDLGGTANGTLDDENGIALYRVQVPGDVPLLAEVTSDDNLDAVLSLVSTGEAGVEPVDFAANGGAEQIIIPSGTSGAQLFAVTAFADTAGTFEFSIRPAPVRALAFGDTLTGHLEPGELAIYTLTTTSASPFAVAFTPGDELDASLDVQGPSGDEFAQTQNLYVSDGAAGGYTFTIRSFDSAGDFYIGAEALASVDSPEQGVLAGAITEPGALLAFDVDVPTGPVRFVSITTDGDLAVDATVTDASGNAVAFAGEPITGAGTMTLADAPGQHRVIVTGISGSGDVRVMAGAAEPTALVPGSTATVDVADGGTVALFTPEPGDDLLAVSVRPSAGVTAAVSLIDSGGNRLSDSGGLSGTPTTHVFDSRMGPVQLIVSTSGGAGELAIRSSALRATPSSVGDVERGSIRAPDDVVAYDIAADYVDNLQVSVSPSVGLDPQVLVIDPSGYPQAIDDVSRGEAESRCVQGGPGLYRVVVGGAAGTTGDFELTLDTVSSDDPDLDATGACFGSALEAAAANLTS